MRILITGSAGFIGFHISKKLMKKGHEIIGIDNLNSYYDSRLKINRHNELKKIAKRFDCKYSFEKCDIESTNHLTEIFNKFNPKYVIHMAAQAGVRYSITNPKAYLNSNLLGFGNILELCKEKKVKHLIYASSSSVYGGNINLPFSEKDNVDHPVSLYAATKKANELMAHSYSHLFNLPTTGLRFFTVYGPWGRPDMALFLFTEAIISNKPIKIFNNGDMIRDFTFIDDIVESIYRLLEKPPTRKSKGNKSFSPAESWSPYQIFNIGNSNAISLMKYIEELEISLDKKAEKIFLPMQDGDVQATEADTSSLEKMVEFKPNTSVREGIRDFVKWYKSYYKITENQQ